MADLELMQRKFANNQISKIGSNLYIHEITSKIERRKQ